MSEAAAPQQLSADEFDALVNAVMETPRGRWFLQEFARRNRSQDTERLLTTIGSLQSYLHTELERHLAVPATLATKTFLLDGLKSLHEAICGALKEIAAIKPENSPEVRFLLESDDPQTIAAAAEQATADTLGASERLQEISEKLRIDGADPDLCDEIDSHASGIFMATFFQDMTGRRTARLVEALSDFEERVRCLLGSEAHEETSC